VPSMGLDLPGLMARLSRSRPIFHSEAVFQHALAWLIHSENPEARIRLETRPERGIRLDMLITMGGELMAIELKYFVARFEGVVGGERFDLPNQAAQDISRHDFIKDITRVEQFVADGVVDSGWSVALTNDGGHWRRGTKSDPVDAMFRIHEGRVLMGQLTWGARAGAGTTRSRELPLDLRGTYTCAWTDYSTIARSGVKPVEFRFLAFEIRGGVPEGPLHQMQMQ
jgi:hypothetical protein